MTDLRPQKQYVRGIVALLFGFLFGAIGILQVFRIAHAFVLNSPLDIWFAVGQIWFFGMAIYLIFVGLRKLSRECNAPQSPASRIGWGRVLIGSFVAYVTLLGHFRPSPSKYRLEPSNETQADVMKATEAVLTVLIPLAGICFAVSGIRKGFKQSDQLDSNVNSASHSAVK